MKFLFGSLFVISFLMLSPINLRSQDITKDPQLVLDAKGFSDPVHRLAISNDGRWLAGAAEKVVRVWDLRDGRLHATLRGYQEPLGYHVGFIDSLTFSPDSRFLVVGISDNFAAGSTRVYDLEEPTKQKSLIKGHLGCTRGVCFSPDGRYFATWGCDGNVIIYDWLSKDAKTSERHRIDWRNFIPARQDVPKLFQFTEDSKFLVFSAQDREAVLNVGTGEAVSIFSRAIPSYIKFFGNRNFRWPLRQLNGSEVLSSCSPSLRIASFNNESNAPWMVIGQTLANGSDSTFTASVFATDGTRTVQCSHLFHISSVSMNTRSNLAASADILGSIKIWELSSGEVKREIEAMNASIWSVFWKGGNGSFLEFSTKNLPKNKFTYNNYGGIDRALNLESSVLTNVAVSGEGNEIKSILKRPTSIRTSFFTLHMKNSVGKTDLHISDEAGTRSLSPLGPAAKPYTSDEGKRRIDAIGNAAVRLSDRFGEVSYFTRLKYPLDAGKETYLLGSKSGNLVEGYFDRTKVCREFRVSKKFVGHTSQVTGADISLDGRLLATSSLDGTIRIWPLQLARSPGDVDFLADGTRIDYIPEKGPSELAGLQIDDVVQFLGKTSFYERIREIHSGNLLAGQIVDITITRTVGGRDVQSKRALRLSATPDIVEPLAGFFLARDGEWVLWNDAGYYNSSTNGAQYIGWHVNNARNEPATFYTSDQFQKALYQPAVVSETFRRGDSREAAIAVLGKEALSDSLGVAVPLASESEATRYVPPEVSIVTPARNSLVQRNRVSIRARVKIPKDVDVREARMFVDGRPHPTPLAVERTGIEGDFRESWFEEEFDLIGGTHVCKLTVETSVNTSASAEVRFEVKGAQNPGQEKNSRGRLFLLAIGISDYLDPGHRLHFAHRDAKEFTALWQNRGRKVFADVQTKLLINSDASIRAIKEDGLDWVLSQDLGPEDTVMVLLTGHGFFDRFDEWYFGGHELDLNRLSTTGISDAELSSFFKKLPTNTIMFLDSCHSGQFNMPKQVSKRSRTGKNLWRGQGKIVFSSCLPGEESWESDKWEHGAFTKAVLDYFSDPEADYNKDGELGCLEMIQFVQDRVRKMTDQKQNPSVEFPSGISDVNFGPVGVLK